MMVTRLLRRMMGAFRREPDARLTLCTVKPFDGMTAAQTASIVSTMAAAGDPSAVRIVARASAMGVSLRDYFGGVTSRQ